MSNAAIQVESISEEINYLFVYDNEAVCERKKKIVFRATRCRNSRNYHLTTHAVGDDPSPLPLPGLESARIPRARTYYVYN